MQHIRKSAKVSDMNTVNEQLIQIVTDNVFCDLVDYGVPAGQAYELSHIDIDPLEVMANVNLEGATL